MMVTLTTNDAYKTSIRNTLILSRQELTNAQK